MSSVLQVYVATLKRLIYRMSKPDDGSSDDKYLAALLLGFVTASLSPFLAVWYALHGATYVVSKVLIPVLGLALIVFVGLPLLCACRGVYATYSLVYRIVVNVVLAAARALEKGRRGRARPAEEATSSDQEVR